MQKYTEPSFFIDSDHADIINYAQKITEGIETAQDKVIALFTAVRDDYFYDPYFLDFTKEGLKASTVVKKQRAYCIEKAVLLTAAIRAVNIPARLYFGNVKNHLAVDRLVEIIKTDLLVFHGCTEVYLNGKWIKITPAFNKELCQKLGVPVMDFDGENETVFQQYAKDGSRFMEYVHEYGSFDDLPYELMLAELKKHYGHIWTDDNLILNLT
jgi:transglutaminase-like putative cysteine protease